MNARSVTVLALAAWILAGSPLRAESPAEAARRRLQESRAHAALPPETEVKETTETYDVGAHYRGTLKKSFHHLGTGTLAFRTVARDRFQVTLEAHVKHPQSQELLECKVQREYQLEGRSIHKVSEKDWFNQAASGHKKRFVDCVALGYVVKWFTPRDGKGAIQPLKFNLDKQTFEITYVAEKRWLEATLRSADGVVGRFYLTPAVGGVRPVDKFRIHAKDQMVISFVRKGLDLTGSTP